MITDNAYGELWRMKSCPWLGNPGLKKSEAAPIYKLAKKLGAKKEKIYHNQASNID